ncbi:alkanesulfonate monooxygenase [Catenulispora sp. GAS73]|uniref:LLM class flavin-dependent oxidoreductase n=1 Tax=Catenulispora sp. GAS73 TaxID=3156269 RepID=UPI003517D45F
MLTIHTTSPMLTGGTVKESLERLDDVTTWTEESGCDGMLVFADNVSYDPWVVAGRILGKSDRLIPLIAANPVYQHPVTVAKSVNSVAAVHNRRIDLNLVAGGFSRHLTQMGCTLDHSERYDRLAEFGSIIAELTTSERPAKYSGTYYKLNAICSSPPPPIGMTPRLYVSGASEDCIRVQRLLDVTRLCYPRQPDQYEHESPFVNGGIRLGIVARDDSRAAWRIARERFPVDRVGEEFHDLAAETVESHWHRRLSQDALRTSKPEGNYWMYPFRAYKTFCPYIVGSHTEVVDLLLRYMRLGASTFILDEPPSMEDLLYSVRSLRQAWARFTADTADQDRGEA